MRALLLACLALALALGLATPAGASPKTTNVLVSGGTTGNSLSNPNTSRTVAVAPNGTVFVAYHGTNGIRVASNTDGGTTFGASVQLSAMDGTVELAADNNGVVYAGYVVGSIAYPTRSTDNGATFAAPTTLGTASGNGTASIHLAAQAPYVYAVDEGGAHFWANGASGVGAFAQVALPGGRAFADVRIAADTGVVYVIADDPTVYLQSSTDHGATFGAVTTYNGASVYYSTAAITVGPNGRAIVISGNGTAAFRINLDTLSSSSQTYPNNASSQTRSLAADPCGNIVAGFTTTGTGYGVSQNGGATFAASVTTSASVTNQSVAINPVTNDVVVAYEVSGQIYASVYQGELGVCAATIANVGGTGPVGDTITYTATLTTTGGAALVGRTVSFALPGGTTATAVTNAQGVATVTGPAPATAGTVTGGVCASFAGDGSTAAVAPVCGDVVTAQGSQTITFPQPTQATPGAPVALAATSSAGLPIAYAATGPCTVSGNVVTPTGNGTCVVTASQAGNANYTPAPNVTRSFAVATTPVATGYLLTLTTDGGGTIGASPAPDVAATRYSAGTLVTLAPQGPASAILAGWRVDGVFQGWAAPLTLTMNADHAVQAVYRTRPAFADVTASTYGAEAIGQLAARGIINGYGDGRFGPTDFVLRAQIAAMVARATGSSAPDGPGIGPATWATEDHGNTFPDRNGVDAEMWRAVGSLEFRNVARGYSDGTYDPTGTVNHAQAISLITRAMVAKGYWTQQPDDATLYPNIPASSGHRADTATFVHYAGVLPQTTPTQVYDGPNGWDMRATRAWVAQALFAALDSYHKVDRVP